MDEATISSKQGMVLIIAGSCLFGLSIAVLVQVPGGYDLHLKNESSPHDESGECVIVVDNIHDYFELEIVWVSELNSPEDIFVKLKSDTFTAYPDQMQIEDSNKDIIRIRKGGLS